MNKVEILAKLFNGKHLDYMAWVNEIGCNPYSMNDVEFKMFIQSYFTTKFVVSKIPDYQPVKFSPVFSVD